MLLSLSNLLLLLFLGFFSIILLPLIPSINTALERFTYRKFSFFYSLIVFIYSLQFWYLFDIESKSFQFVEVFSGFSSYNTHFIFGLDGISLFFVLLTTFLIPLCILISSDLASIKVREKEFLLALFAIEFFLVLAFVALDILLFYVSFEAILLPMYFLIGIWGSRERKILASYYFFFYTLIGSLLMLVGIIYVQKLTGTTSLLYLKLINFLPNDQLYLFWLFFFGFAIKIPMYPFHIWLPEAHVEAPTAGSVILAGLLLKLGGYGFLRYSIPLFPYASAYCVPFIYTLAFLSIVYASCSALRQIDMKRVIAYSSVAHMNVVVLGIFSFTEESLCGSILLMLSHGLVSSGLFIMVGVLYARYGTRLIFYYGGLASTMPNFSFFFFLLALSNFSFPGTGNFVGEILTFMGLIFVVRGMSFFFFLGVILGLIYTMLMFSRLFFGTVKYNFIQVFKDLTWKEFWVLSSLIYLNILLGFYPDLILDTIGWDIKMLLADFYAKTN